MGNSSPLQRRVRFAGAQLNCPLQRLDRFLDPLGVTGVSPLNKGGAKLDQDSALLLYQTGSVGSRRCPT
jgi:hypothetical protein